MQRAKHCCFQVFPQCTLDVVHPNQSVQLLFQLDPRRLLLRFPVVRRLAVGTGGIDLSTAHTSIRQQQYLISSCIRAGLFSSASSSPEQHAPSLDGRFCCRNLATSLIQAGLSSLSCRRHPPLLLVQPEWGFPSLEIHQHGKCVRFNVWGRHAMLLGSCINGSKEHCGEEPSCVLQRARVGLLLIACHGTQRGVHHAMLQQEPDRTIPRDRMRRRLCAPATVPTRARLLHLRLPEVLRRTSDPSELQTCAWSASACIPCRRHLLHARQYDMRLQGRRWHSPQRARATVSALRGGGGWPRSGSGGAVVIGGILVH